jgi:signal transduction histidine kinase
VHVRDTGIGIDPQDQPRVFERFCKVDKGRAGNTGTGLGLATVKHLATAMGGRVGVHSEPGAGSDFFFTLPPAPAGQRGAAA